MIEDFKGTNGTASVDQEWPWLARKACGIELDDRRTDGVVESSVRVAGVDGGKEGSSGEE